MDIDCLSRYANLGCHRHLPAVKTGSLYSHPPKIPLQRLGLQFQRWRGARFVVRVHQHRETRHNPFVELSLPPERSLETAMKRFSELPSELAYSYERWERPPCDRPRYNDVRRIKHTCVWSLAGYHDLVQGKNLELHFVDVSPSAFPSVEKGRRDNEFLGGGSFPYHFSWREVRSRSAVVAARFR